MDSKRWTSSLLPVLDGSAHGGDQNRILWMRPTQVEQDPDLCILPPPSSGKNRPRGLTVILYLGIEFLKRILNSLMGN